MRYQKFLLILPLKLNQILLYKKLCPGPITFILNKKLNSNWYYYGFFRHWNLEVSDTVSCSPSLNCAEPKNTTNETGLGISFAF